MDTEVNGLNKRGIQAAMNGNILDAEKCFKEALSLNTTSLDSIYNLVKLFYMQKRSLDVTELYLKNIPSNSLADIPPPIVSMVASCFVEQFNFEQAIYLLEFIHHSHPRDIETSCKLSNLLIQNGRLAQAKKVLDTSNNLIKNDPNILTQLAIVESELGHYSHAENIHQKLVSLYGRFFLSHFNYALFLSMLGREDESLSLLQVCLKLVPNAPEALAEIDRITLKSSSLLSEIYRCIESKDWDSVVKLLCNAKSKLDPIYYWSIISDLPPNIACLIEDIDSLLPTTQIEILNIFNSAEDRNHYLPMIENYIKDQESLIFNRAGKPTRFGSQSHEILKGSNDPVIVDLKCQLITAISNFLECHPLLLQISKQKSLKNELSGWAVVLNQGGFQKRHIHPEAIVSGVVYIKLSDETKDKSVSAGNLLFHSSKKQVMVTPEEGLVALFPSYLAHETIPIEIDHERICIAFNYS
tara:strand:+ start:1125 stop:2531 length:1407 start_codon:yes stop_codon:yes gene_type:complete